MVPAFYHMSECSLPVCFVFIASIFTLLPGRHTSQNGIIGSLDLVKPCLSRGFDTWITFVCSSMLDHICSQQRVGSHSSAAACDKERPCFISGAGQWTLPRRSFTFEAKHYMVSDVSL